MKIALLAAYLPPHNDGVGDHADMLARTLAAAGHDVLVISVGEASPASTYRLTLVGKSWGLLATARAMAALRAHRAQAVIVEYTPFYYGAASPAPLAALLMARAMRIRSALVVHEAFYAAGSGGVTNAGKAKFFAARDAVTISAADVVAVSSATRAAAIASRLPAAGSRIVVVPISANVEPPPGYRRAERPLRTIVCFGVVMPRRRLEHAVEAMVALLAGGVDAQLEIIGRTHDAAYATAIRELAERRGISDRVTFRGELEPDRISDAFAQASAAVHAPNEGSIPASGSLLALIAHGVPTVALRTPYDDDVFSGALRFAADEAELAVALGALIGEPQAARELSARARNCYQTNFTWTLVADRLLHALAK